MRFCKKTLIVACGFAFSASASASLIDTQESINPGSFEIPEHNDYANGSQVSDPLITVGDNVDLGQSVVATTSDPIDLTFTYLFKEANFENSFRYKGEELFNTRNDSWESNPSVTRTHEGEGPLDFEFRSISHTGNVLTEHNEVNDGTADHNFFTYAGEGYILLGLDDSGARDDDDYDDMLIKVSASAAQVPEPGTLALLGLGMAGMGLSLRRRRANAA